MSNSERLWSLSAPHWISFNNEAASPGLDATSINCERGNLKVVVVSITSTSFQYCSTTYSISKFPSRSQRSSLRFRAPRPRNKPAELSRAKVKIVVPRSSSQGLDGVSGLPIIVPPMIGPCGFRFGLMLLWNMPKRARLIWS